VEILLESKVNSIDQYFQILFMEKMFSVNLQQIGHWVFSFLCVVCSSLWAGSQFMVFVYGISTLQGS